MSLVSLVEAHNRSDLVQAISRSLDLIKYQFAEEVENVVIKPNMCYYWDYSTGETTDPAFVAALVDVIRSKVAHNVKISVVESDASAMKCKYAFKFLGYEKMAADHGIDLVNLSEEKSERVEISVGDELFHFTVPKIIRNADLRVNVPKIKYQTFTKISCALKNIYGCNPYPKKFKYHQKIDQIIVALNKIMKFDLCVVDGVVVSGSQPRKLGLVMASHDLVAIDVAAAKLLQVNPRSVRHIMLASKERIGDTSFITTGFSLGHFKKRFPRMGAKEKLMDFGYKLVNTLGLNHRLGLA